MAEKPEEDQTPVQNLTCPLCLDIFDDATILTSCGHTFCRKCLKKYDLSHQDLDHMVCPLCRTITKLSTNRVDDLHTNVTVNGLVDDYHCKRGGINALLEMRPNCTACKLQCEAVSFCRTCNNYMCDKCLHCHQHLTSVFEGHEIISIQDIMKGNVSIGHHSSEKCFTHKQENKDMFCENCKVHACLKCVIVGHQNHKIKNQEDFEHDLRIKVNDLIHRCATKKTELEKNIQNVETERHEVHSFMQKLQEDVIQAYSNKAKRLEENQRTLIEEIHALKRSFDEDLDTLKSSDRQKIKSICSSMTLVDNDRLGRLEMDSLSAHTLLCDELDSMLMEVTDQTSAVIVTKRAQKKRFHPSEETSIDLGHITEADKKLVVNGAAGHASAGGVTQKAKKNSADDSRLDLRNISQTPKKLQIIQCVDAKNPIFGICKYSDDSVAVAYGDTRGIDIISSAGNKEQYTKIPSNVKCRRVLFQQYRSVCITTVGNEVHVYSSNGSLKSTIAVPGQGSLNLSASPSDEIIVTDINMINRKQVYIYDRTGTTLKNTLQSKHDARQAPGTSSGLIVVSSCLTKPSMVTVHDRDGNAGRSLQGSWGVYLYAAVDEQDRVYVASVYWSGNVVIRLYDIDGLNLVERVEFSKFNLELSRNWGVRFVSLSPDLLALSCGPKLHFIKVSH